MQVRVEIFTVNKRFPLTISRGTTAQTTNVWLRVEEMALRDGEASPFFWGTIGTETIRNALQQVAPELQAFSPLERQQIELVLNEAQVPCLHGRRWMWRYMTGWERVDYRCGVCGDWTSIALCQLR